MKTVGIIGGAGFIGSHITQQFLKNDFKVKISATDLSNKEKYRHLQQLGSAENIELVELNVKDKKALQQFVAGCQIVVHGGTPFILNVQDPQTELFDPTIKGTENFLEVIKATPGIEKVILIASVAAYNTNFPLPPSDKSPSDCISEKDIKFTSELSHPYAQAKFIANQIVEKFIADNPGISFEICSVSPVFVIGKPLSAREDSTSGGMQFLFKNKIAPDPFVQMMYDTDVVFAAVDVKDVALAIYKAAITQKVHGKNYLLSSESYCVSDLSLMLNGKEPQYAPVIIYRNELAKIELEMAFRPVKETLHKYALHHSVF